MKTFSLPIRIYYEDTDCGGVVYHSKFINFMERARSEMLLHSGLDFHELAEQDIFFVVAHLEIDYLKPAKLNEHVVATATISDVGNSSMTFAQSVHNQDNKDCIYAKAHVKVVCVNKRGRPIRVPTVIKEALQHGN